jgi:hypothetical protein
MNKLVLPMSISLLYLLMFHVQVTYARLANDTVRAENIHSEVVGGKVVVHYDLLGPACEKLKIGLVLLSRDDPAYSYKPVAVSGDVGTVLSAGYDKQILWDIAREFRKGLDTGMYFFRVDAETVKEGINPWILVGGAAIIAGSVVLILASKSGGSAPVNLELPDPFGRPNR